MPTNRDSIMTNLIYMENLGKIATGVNPGGTRDKASTLECGGRFSSFLDIGDASTMGGLPPFLEPIIAKFRIKAFIDFLA